MAGQTIARPQGGKTQRYVFYLGLLLAGIAAVIVFVAVNGADSGGGGGSGNVPVVVANEAIPAQTRITSDMLKVEFVSPDKAEANAFTSRTQLVDRVVTEEVAAGAQILPSAVSNTAGDGLAFKVEPGMRGLSVNVNEVVTAGGNIKPGDHVDMVAIFQLETVEAANHLLAQLGTPYSVTEPPVAPADADETERPRIFVLTVTLIQNVKVLGLAQTLTPTTAGGTFAEEVDETIAEPQASTATVEVTPDNAQMLTTADEYGVIRFDVRAPGDESIVEVQPTFIVVD
ncbi:MAG: Flp pilus assembly protein CpaB [Chloroflexi bacterium]|nr:Flp pilus assembly protein CpaB [Chloroflexota bacterium]